MHRWLKQWAEKWFRIAAGSRDHINAMDMVDGYGDGGDPVIEKSQFILSLFEQLDKKGSMRRNVPLLTDV